MYDKSGHRQRMKERFLNEGLDGFAEVNALELLLFYAVPQRDTKLIARALLNHFGSYARVMEASPAELKAVPGVGDGIACFLPMITAAGRYYQVKRLAVPEIFDSTEKCGKYLQTRFYGRSRETVMMLCLDAKCKLLCCQEVAEGDINSASVPIRRMVEVALGAGASSVVLAHNHPSGLALPSQEDCVTTQRLATALAAMDIVLADHIVISDEDFVSMVQSRMYHPKEWSCMP